jgi:hypothetical protein
MLGKKSSQNDLFDVGNVFPLELKPRSFHAQLAQVAPTLFCDDEFAALYSTSNGRPSVAPSQLALVMILQAYEHVSDNEAIERTAYDLRWNAVLGRLAGTPFCAKSTLQLFRAHLIIHEQFAVVFKKSIEEARKNKLIKGNLKAALDTKPMIGRGAVEDTYNLISTGMLQLARVVARQHNQTLPVFLAENRFKRLSQPSVKGAADIDWSDEEARNGFLTELVADARRLISTADGSVPQVKEAAHLLESILLQDVEEKQQGGASIKNGTAKGRIPSATDPEQRHGRKSAKKRFTGAKASIAVDAETGIILALDVLSGDSPDATGALKLVEQAEENSGCEVVETLADCAYGNGATRQEFADANRILTAKVASTPVCEYFPKTAFRIELPVLEQPLEQTQITCPAGKIADSYNKTKDGGVTFHFATHCENCELRLKCTKSKLGRSVRIHPQEPLIQGARALQKTADGRAKLRQRLTVENALARLGAHGVGQARYFGLKKSNFQLSITAAVVNFRRTWNWIAAKTNGAQAVAG